MIRRSIARSLPVRGCTIDPLALAIARDLGWLPPTGHLIDLSPQARTEVRAAARLALLDRPWYAALAMETR